MRKTKCYFGKRRKNNVRLPPTQHREMVEFIKGRICETIAEIGKSMTDEQRAAIRDALPDTLKFGTKE